MAFSFASVAAGQGGGSSDGVRVQDGPDLQEIQTDQLGFQAVNGEAKLQLLSKPWSSDDLPIPSASLLGVASSQGILAAAGPDALIIVSTENVRQALQEKGEENVRHIEPLLSIPHSRLSHIAFSADESVLLVAEHNHGGITAYQVEKLKGGNVVPALQLPTNDSALRALVPNPAIKTAQYFAAVTMNGELLLADLGSGQLKQTPNDGPVLMRNVSCLAWSKKGKQIIAGLADGTAVQLKPDGTVVSRLPKSTSVTDNVHVSCISWLKDDTFQVIYTPNDISTDSGILPSEYYIVNREKGTESYMFQKLPEVLPPFGLERVPTHHFVSRLNEWEPGLEDLMILSATTATDIGLLSKAKHALSPSEPVTDAFTFTTIDNDARRAALPLSVESMDTTPIGMAIDLSAKENITRPIPTDEEILETSGPVPNLLVLNNEGILCSWWIIYNDSIREKTMFSGFATLIDMEQARSASTQTNTVATASIQMQQPAISKEMVSNTSSPFARPTTNFGSASAQQSFGTGASFGSVSKIGETKSSWTSTGFGNSSTTNTGGSSFGKTGFGQPAFGAPSAISSSGTPAFGSSGAFGSRPAAFGQPAPAAPAFGQTTFGATPTSSSAFGSGTSASPFVAPSNSSGFASFSSGGGFAAAGNDAPKDSPFAKAPGGGGFGQTSTSSSPFAKASSSNVFGQKSGSNTFGKAQPFGATTSNSNPMFGSTNSFKLGSTFKGDGTAKDDLPKPAAGKGFGFGSGFGDILGEASPVVSPTRDIETEMDDKIDEQDEATSDKDEAFAGFSPDQPKATDEAQRSLVTPPSTISQPKSTPAPPLSNLFGKAPDQNKTPETTNTTWAFGKITSTTPKDTPAPSKTLFGTETQAGFTPADVQKSKPVNAFASIEHVKTPEPKTNANEDSAPRIYTESPSDNETVEIKKISEAPLPPESMSKPGYQTGDTSMSSINSSKPEEAPLPPDFLPANKSATSNVEVELPTDDAETDAEGYSSGFEDSGEDITQDVSAADGSEIHQDLEDDKTSENQNTKDQVATSSENRFGTEKTSTSLVSPTGGLFTQASTNQPTKITRPLFGEVGVAGPIFPPPKPQESPRSPSPVRQLLPHDSLRSDSRSVSAPPRPRSAIDQRKAEYAQSAIALQAARAREEELANERARADAAKQAQDKLRAEELEALEDDEDERIQKELAQPLAPSETMDAFITYQAAPEIQTAKADIPAQIERLYQDINSMIYTLGINARSLSSFLLYQTTQEPNHSWPAVLGSDTPLDAMNDEWFLGDIEKLYDGSSVLETDLEQPSLLSLQQKLDSCHGPMTQDLYELKAKVKLLRKSLSARRSNTNSSTPLSAEQISIQNDLRKAAADVQTKLVKIEDNLSILRAKLADVAPPDSAAQRKSMFGSTQPRKPTVEAVTNTVTKMTSMAEKKSADVDVLEAQLKRMGLASSMIEGGTPVLPMTPQRGAYHQNPDSPASTKSSVYHTPVSINSSSRRATPAANAASRRANGISMVSNEDRDRWRAKARRKQDVAAALRKALSEKREKAITSA